MTEPESKREADKTARLPLALCWVAFSLFDASLALPALRVQGKGEWIAGDLGFQCVFLSLAEFPCWVPHALAIAAPFIAMFAGKPAQKVAGMVLGITTLTVLQVCIPQEALTNFRQGPLWGFWLWAAALITAAAGLLLGGFSPVRAAEPGPSSTQISERGRIRPRGAILLCWLAFAIFVVGNLVIMRHLFDGSSPGGLSTGIAFVLDQLVIPSILAMAPLACIHASAPGQRFMALALGFLGLLPFLSINRPADQPFQALAPLLVSYLTVALAAAGLLIAAGFLNRNRVAPAGPSESVNARFLERERGTSEASRASARGSPPLGAALCWLALAHSLGLGLLAFHHESIIQSLSMLAWIITFPTSTRTLLAMAPWVCTYSGPVFRRALGALLVLGTVMMLRGIWWFGHGTLPAAAAMGLSAAGLIWADVALRRRS